MLRGCDYDMTQTVDSGIFPTSLRESQEYSFFSCTWGLLIIVTNF